MLRREKRDVFKAAGEAAAGEEGAAAANLEEPAADATAPGGAVAQGVVAAAAAVAGGVGGSMPAAMPHKNDLIVWLKLKPMQRKVYQAFLNSGGWAGSVIHASDEQDRENGGRGWMARAANLCSH